jgi:hypothetical protein
MQSLRMDGLASFSFLVNTAAVRLYMFCCNLCYTVRLTVSSCCNSILTVSSNCKSIFCC